MGPRECRSCRCANASLAARLLLIGSFSFVKREFILFSLSPAMSFVLFVTHCQLMMKIEPVDRRNEERARSTRVVMENFGEGNDESEREGEGEKMAIGERGEH